MKPLALMTRAWLIAAATCVLAACGGDGGGSDTPSQPATNAYLGSWVRVAQEGCRLSTEVNMYARLTWTLTQGAGSDLHSRAQIDFYEDARCTRFLGVIQEEGNLSYVGQRVRYLGRGEGTVDRYIYQWFGTTARDVTGATAQRTSPWWLQQGQDVSLYVENGMLRVYFDSQPELAVDSFVR